MDAGGGAGRRLTWLGANTRTVGWTRDGSGILFQSNAARPFARDQHLHAVPAAGGPTERLPWGTAHEIAFEPERARRRPRPQLGRSGALEALSRRHRRHAVDRSQGRRPLRAARSGEREHRQPDVDRGAHLVPLRSRGPRQPLLVHAGRARPSPSHRPRGLLRALSVERRAPHRLPRRRRPPSLRRRDREGRADRGDALECAPGPAAALRRGRRASRDRGSPPRRIEPRRRGAWRRVHARALGGSAAATRRSGRSHSPRALPPRRRAARGRHRRRRRRDRWWSFVPTAPGGRRPSPATSAARSTWSRRRRRLPPPWSRSPITGRRSGSRTCRTARRALVETSRHDRIAGLAWSPDGRWLAYGFYSTRRSCSIHLFDRDSGTIHQITRPEFVDYAPAFDPEGKYLYFLSLRGFDPVPDYQYFDFGFPRSVVPCLVPLADETPSPFDAAMRAPHRPRAKPSRPEEPCQRRGYPQRAGRPRGPRRPRGRFPDAGGALPPDRRRPRPRLHHFGAGRRHPRPGLARQGTAAGQGQGRGLGLRARPRRHAARERHRDRALARRSHAAGARRQPPARAAGGDRGPRPGAQGRARPRVGMDRPRPAASRGGARARVAADAARSVAAPARSVLDRGSLARRMDPRARTVPAAGRARRHALRVLRPDLGAPGRARHLALLRAGR